MRQRTRLLALAGIGLVLVAAYLLFRYVGTDATALQVRLKPGQSYSWTFDRKSTVNLNMMALLPTQPGMSIKQKNDGKMTSIRVEDRGRLQLRVYQEHGGGWTVGGVISDYGALDNADNAAALSPSRTTMSSCPFLFDLSPQGEIGNFRFGYAVTGAERLQIQSVLYELQVILPKQSARQWQTVQRDTMGEFKAAYRITEGKHREKALLKRTIREYVTNELAASRFSPTVMAAQLKVINDQAEVELWRDNGMAQTVTHAQHTRMVSGETLLGDSNTIFAAHAVDSVSTKLLPDNLDALLSRQVACSQKQIEEQTRSTDPELNRQAADLNLNGALDRFFNLLNAGEFAGKKQAEAFLVNYFRLHPQEIAGVIRYIDQRASNSLDMQKELALWNVIAQTGNHEAQQALAGALADNRLNLQTRTTAANHLFNLRYPEPSLVDALWTFQKSATNPDLKNTALFAIGAIAANTAISDGMRTSVLQQLSTLLADARSSRETVIALSAIGNTGRPEMIPELQRYLQAPDQQVRAEAYRALTKIPAEHSLDVIRQSYRSETDSTVKAGILTAVAGMSATEQVSAFFRSEAQSASGSSLLVPTAAYLARNAKQSEANIQALNSIIARNPSGQVLREIYRYVSPDTLKGRK